MAGSSAESSSGLCGNGLVSATANNLDHIIINPGLIRMIKANTAITRIIRAEMKG